MGRARSERRMVTRLDARGARRRPDRLIVEEPMSIQLDGTTVATTMRTPGHDFELAVGWCVTEGLIAPGEVRTVRYCGTGSAVATAFNQVTVETGTVVRTVQPRLGTVGSACGWCGSDQLEDLCARVAPLPAVDPIPFAVVTEVLAGVRAQQPLFAETGAVHAAAAFDVAGRIGPVREDVGRHNAVDKVVGALAMAARLPATGQGLFVSGRASVEMVAKAWAAGFTTLVAVSAPTALAVTTAERAGMTLYGFWRDEGLNMYAGPGRAPAQ